MPGEPDSLDASAKPLLLHDLAVHLEQARVVLADQEAAAHLFERALAVSLAQGVPRVAQALLDHDLGFGLLRERAGLGIRRSHLEDRPRLRQGLRPPAPAQEI